MAAGGMELFELMARLVLKSDEYEKALNRAEQMGRSFDGDAEGTITGHDNYTDVVGEAQDAADGFTGDVTGTLTGTDDYSDDADAAQTSANAFDGDVDGDITGTDSYTAAEETAQTSADDFTGDVSGEITGTDNYSDDVTAAQTAADGFSGDISGTITLEHADYDQALTDAGTNATAFEATFSSITARLGSALTAAGITAAIGAISKAFQDAVSNAATYADTVDKGSRALSMSTATYQVWDHVLKQSGADISAVNRGWLQMTDAIDTAKNHQEDWEADTSDLKKALETLGVNPKNFETVDDMFSSIVDQLAMLAAGPERDALTRAIFGRGGTQLNAMLDSGVAGIKALKDEAYDLGLVMSDEDITSGVAYGDALANMNAAIEALKQNIVSGLFPLLTDAANMITNIVAFFNGRTHDGGVTEWFSDIDESMKDAFAQTTVDEAKAGSLIDQLKAMSDETGKCVGNLDLWRSIANELITLCPTLADQIDLPTGSFSEQTGTLESNTEAWFKNARAQAVATALQDKQAALAKQAGAIVEKQLDAAVAQAEAEGQRQLVISLINKQIENLGIGKNEDYKPEKIAGMDLYELMDVQEQLGNMRDREGFASGLWSDTEQAILDADAAMADAEKAQAEIATAQAELETATAQYEQYAQAADSYLKTVQEGLAGIPSTVSVDINLNDPYALIDGSHAKGLNYTPYDGYIAELHRGEVVLNQAQSREYLNGGSSGIDADAIAGVVAEAISNAMSGMAINMDGTQVGNVVTSQVSRNLAAQMRSRRYT